MARGNRHVQRPAKAGCPTSPAGARPGQLQRAEDLIRLGRLDEATVLLAKLCRRKPRQAPAWEMLASVQGMQGAYEQAAESCRRVLAITPSNPAALNLLGAAYTALGRLDEAVEQLRRAASILPGDPGVLNNLGNALYGKGRVDEAAASYEAALSVNPRHAQAQFGLGNCRSAQGRWSEALTAYHQAAQGMPESYEILMALGGTHRHLGDLAEALACFGQARGLTDSPVAALIEEARVLQLQGALDAALRAIEQVLEIQPGNTEAGAVKAEVLYRLGDRSAAHQAVHALLEQGPPALPLVLVWGEFCHTYDECARVISEGDRLLREGRLAGPEQASLHYLLGRLHDRQGSYDSAFAHYERANALLPARFDREGHRGMVQELVRGYSREVVSELPRSRCDDARPVFIVGMPRSGTSLVEQILASHRGVFGAGELSHIKDLAGRVFAGKKGRLSSHLQAMRPEKLDELAGRYLDLLGREARSFDRITDKMPANFLWLGFIAQLFPQARVIHCMRDPRDTCLSIYFQQFHQGHTYATDLGDLAFYFRRYEELMSHWREILPLPMLEVRYEDLVADPEHHTRAMIDFLGLPWDPACLDHHSSRRVVATASWDQVRQPVYKRSAGRWRRYLAQLGPLAEEFGAEETPG